MTTTNINRAAVGLVISGLLATSTSACSNTDAANESGAYQATPSGRSTEQNQVVASSAEKPPAGFETLNVADKYRQVFEALTPRGRALLVALYREGKHDLLDQSIAEADLHEKWLTANFHEVWRPEDQYMHHDYWLEQAHLESRVWHRVQYPQYAKCLNKFGLQAKTWIELSDKYAGKGSVGIPYGLNDEQLAAFKAKVSEAEQVCTAPRYPGRETLWAEVGEMAADLQREMNLPVGLQTLKPGEKPPPKSKPREKRIPTCLKDEAGYVYHGGKPQHPKGDRLRVAGLKADVPELKKLLKENPDEFAKPKHAWIVPLLARNGCIEALDVVLKSSMPVDVPELFGGRVVPWKEDAWDDIGSYATVETFDKILSRATAQNGGKPIQVAPIARDICNYPASFVPILAKNGITGLENMAAPGNPRDSYLWASVVHCSSAEFVSSFFKNMGDKKPKGALAQVTSMYCYGETTGKWADVPGAVRMIQALRGLGYKADDVGTIWVQV